MQKAEKRLLNILRRAKAAGIPPETIAQQMSKEGTNATSKLLKISKPTRKLAYFIIIFIISILILAKYFRQSDSECFIEMPFDGTKVFRKPEDCSMCTNVTQVDRISNISHDDFEHLYALKARPLIVTDGTRDWSSIDTFNFDFFKQLYAGHPQNSRSACQFFPYNTEFTSLQQVLNMDESRSRLEEGTLPWYIGWSNCNDAAGKILREHYKRPYFLPDTSENMALSWIFMGGPGAGAHMHVDNVRYASWQAQLRGMKKWRLAPPPECYYACTEFEAIVKPGEIIVVDTNRWYHQTHILPGDISITIGTEFD